MSLNDTLPVCVAGDCEMIGLKGLLLVCDAGGGELIGLKGLCLSVMQEAAN